MSQQWVFGGAVITGDKALAFPLITRGQQTIAFNLAAGKGAQVVGGL